MKKLYLFLLLLMPISVVRAMDGPSRFEAFNTFAQEYFYTAFSIPENYYAEYDDYAKTYIPNLNLERLENKREWRSIGAYCASAINKDCQSKILYPWVGLNFKGIKRYDSTGNANVFSITQYNYLSELHCCINEGFAHNEKQPSVDPTPYLIAKLGGEEARKWGNADSVYVVDLPVTTTFECRYTHCIGVYMAKKGYKMMFYKILMTDKAYAERDKRIEATKNCLSFIKEDWVFDEHKAFDARKKLYEQIQYRIDPTL